MAGDSRRDSAFNRRTVLTGAIAALAAAATRALGGVDRVVAANTSDGQTVTIGGYYGLVDSTTFLQNTDYDRSLIHLNLANPGGSRAALDASATGGPGVSGSSNSQAGIEGASVSGPGLSGRSHTSSGVVGTALGSGSSDAHEAYGVFGATSLKNGRAVFGWNQSATTGGGVWGQADGADGVGVRGYAWDGSAARGSFGTGVLGSSGSHAFPPPAARSNTGVVGVAAGGTGVYGHDNTGRGGVFSGGAAQLRLIPSSDANPPAKGAQGDLFLDSSCRLWLCAGASTWTRIG